MKHLLTALWLVLLATLGPTASGQPRRPEFDPLSPDVHDPVMALGEDGRYYIYSTGMGVGVMSSADLKEWRREPSVFTMKALPVTDSDAQRAREGRWRGPKIDWEHSTLPRWTVDSVRGYTGHTWAPDISRHDSLWYLYYSCSTFGKNGSAIGLAVSRSLDPASPGFGWQDRGPVVVSHPRRDNWNAIDPNLIVAADGQPWLVWGSFWDGIQLAPLAADMQTLTRAPRTVARRLGRRVRMEDIEFTVEGRDTIEAGDNAIEAPFLISRDGWYYLLVSLDYCCRGARSTYRTVYGRSRSVEGPYLDRDGRDMATGGGTQLVGPDERYYGVGHCSAYCLTEGPGARLATTDLPGGRWIFVCHAYDATQGARAKLYMRPMTFDADGWITLGD